MSSVPPAEGGVVVPDDEMMTTAKELAQNIRDVVNSKSLVNHLREETAKLTGYNFSETEFAGILHNFPGGPMKIGSAFEFLKKNEMELMSADLRDRISKPKRRSAKKKNPAIESREWGLTEYYCCVVAQKLVISKGSYTERDLTEGVNEILSSKLTVKYMKARWQKLSRLSKLGMSSTDTTSMFGKLCEMAANIKERRTHFVAADFKLLWDHMLSKDSTLGTFEMNAVNKGLDPPWGCKYYKNVAEGVNVETASTLAQQVDENVAGGINVETARTLAQQVDENSQGVPSRIETIDNEGRLQPVATA